MQPPILDNKIYDAPSIFTAKNLLREARRQKSIPDGSIPTVCILDPDGDMPVFWFSIYPDVTNLTIHAGSFAQQEFSEGASPYRGFGGGIVLQPYITSGRS